MRIFKVLLFLFYVGIIMAEHNEENNDAIIYGDYDAFLPQNWKEIEVHTSEVHDEDDFFINSNTVKRSTEILEQYPSVTKTSVNHYVLACILIVTLLAIIFDPYRIGIFNTYMCHVNNNKVDLYISGNDVFYSINLCRTNLKVILSRFMSTSLVELHSFHTFLTDVFVKLQTHISQESFQSDVNSHQQLCIAVTHIKENLTSVLTVLESSHNVNDLEVYAASLVCYEELLRGLSLVHCVESSLQVLLVSRHDYFKLQVISDIRFGIQNQQISMLQEGLYCWDLLGLSQVKGTVGDLVEESPLIEAAKSLVSSYELADDSCNAADMHILVREEEELSLGVGICAQLFPTSKESSSYQVVGLAGRVSLHSHFTSESKEINSTAVDCAVRNGITSNRSRCTSTCTSIGGVLNEDYVEVCEEYDDDTISEDVRCYGKQESKEEGSNAIKGDVVLTDTHAVPNVLLKTPESRYGSSFITPVDRHHSFTLDRTRWSPRERARERAIRAARVRVREMRESIRAQALEVDCRRARQETLVALRLSRVQETRVAVEALRRAQLGRHRLIDLMVFLGMALVLIVIFVTSIHHEGPVPTYDTRRLLVKAVRRYCRLFCAELGKEMTDMGTDTPEKCSGDGNFYRSCRVYATASWLSLIPTDTFIRLLTDRFGFLRCPLIVLHRTMTPLCFLVISRLFGFRWYVIDAAVLSVCAFSLHRPLLVLSQSFFPIWRPFALHCILYALTRIDSRLRWRLRWPTFGRHRHLLALDFRPLVVLFLYPLILVAYFILDRCSGHSEWSFRVDGGLLSHERTSCISSLITRLINLIL